MLPGSSRTGALTFLGAFCVLAALVVAVVVRDPARPAQSAAAGTSPYRGPVLWRIHATSALLVVVPQFAVATFGLVYLVDERGWAAHDAGQLLAVAALGGAVTGSRSATGRTGWAAGSGRCASC